LDRKGGCLIKEDTEVGDELIRIGKKRLGGKEEKMQKR